MAYPTMSLRHWVVAAAGLSVVGTAHAQATACAKPIAPQKAAPSVAPGFRVEVVANGLNDPRSLLFGQQGGLLVVEQGRGISRLSLTGDGACVQVQGQVQNVVADDSVSSAVVQSGGHRGLD